MNMNSVVSSFLTNQWVLRVIAFLALLNIIGYLVLGNINAVLYFTLFAIVVRYFSKNMTLVLGAPLLLVNLLVIRGNLFEGMNNNEEQEKEQDDNIENDGTETLTTDKEEETQDDDEQMRTDETVVDSIHTSDDNTKDGFACGCRKQRGYDIGYAANFEEAYAPK